MDVDDNTRPYSLRLVDNPNDRLDRWPGSVQGLSMYPTFEETIDGFERLVTNIIQGSEYSITIDFDPRDCRSAEHPTVRNCSETCTDPESLLIPTNVRPCILIGAASLLVHKNMATLDRSHHETAATLETLAIPELSTFDTSWLFTHFLQCLSASCEKTDFGRCSPSIKELGNNIPTSSWNLTNLKNIGQDLGTKYCSGAYISLNGDLAGPGVAMSYILQAAFALSLYTLFNISLLCTNLKHLSFPKLLSRSAQKPSRSQKTSLKFKPATIASLTEFQEIQIYFVLSLQVASLFTSFSPSDGTTTFNTTLLAISVVRALSIMSIAPVLLVQCCLVRRAGKNWWYTFLPMSTAFIMSMRVLRYYTYMPSFNPDALWDKLKEEAPIQACGGQPSPMVLCMTWITTQTPNLEAFKATAGICVAAWSWLVYKKVTSRFSGCVGPRLKRILMPVRQILEGLMIMVEVCLVGFTGYYGIYVHNSLWKATRRPDLGSSATWGFGQFVAVMIWAPTIAKFFYFLVFGIKKGFDERLAEPYIVMAKDELEFTDNTCEKNTVLPSPSAVPLRAVEAKKTAVGNAVTVVIEPGPSEAVYETREYSLGVIKHKIRESWITL
ncbi:hypothetical protein QBC38DRAFT_503112 [Podospora fimiseda]|uniref:Uncharacterized protein n=1 Tax=Podospora fimiseda TaxID=252190 RepID=A0AAN7BHF6_9PEZI|nr:hypothetical protein QBC38DRAFT_503112 [Podospora fimiseda]